MGNSPNYPNKMPNAIVRLSFSVFGVLFFLLAFVDFANAATQWVSDPGTCNITDPTNFPGQNCSPNRMCGDTSGIAQCYNTASLLPPAVSATSNTLYSASYPNGGYIVNCYATSDAASPFCDNNGAYWCNRSNTCYTTQLRDTTCTANTWGTATCGSCRTGYGDCNADGGVCEVQFNTTNYPTGTNNHYGVSCLVGDVRCDSGYYDCDATGVAVGNGCEALRSGACTTGGGLAGTWSCSVDAGGSCTDGGSNYTCTCIPPKQYFETGTKAQYGTSDPLLWGVQFGAGRLIQFGNSSNEQLFAVNNDGSVELATITAPVTTTNKLYNVAGSLYWNGVMIGAGGSASGTAIWDTDLDTGIQTEENADEDMIRMDVGGMEAVLIQNTVSEPLLRVTGPVGGRVSLLTNVNDEYDAFEINTVDALGGFGGDINMILNPEEGFNVYYSSNVSNISLTGSAFQVGVNNHLGALYVSSDGYLGIGTQIPNTLLHVQGGANGPAVLTLDSDDGSANGVDAGVRINSDYANGSDAAYVTFNNNGVQSAKFYGSPLGSGFIVDGNNPFDIVTNGATRLFIAGDGNVGVGTASPSTLLDVKSSDVGLIAKFSDNNLPDGFGIGTDLWGGESGFYDMETGQLIVGRSVTDSNLLMLGQAALFVDQTTKYVGIANGYMNPQFPLHIISDAGINTYFQMQDSSRGGVYIGNGSVYSADEAGLYDVESDYPLAVFDAQNSIIHYGNNINVKLDEWKVAINKWGNNTANAYLEIVDPYPVPGIEPLLRLNNGTGVVDMFVVSSNPDGVVTAPRGSLAMDYANGNLYINKDNLTSWSLVGAGTGSGDNIYTVDGAIAANRNVTINDGNYLHFRDEQDAQNYLYFLTDYTTNGNLMIGGHNNSEGSRNHFIEFKDNLNLISEGGIEINASSNQIDMYAANGMLQIGGGNSFTDSRAVGSRQGLVYADDYSADFVDRSLVDKAYVDGVVGFGGAMTLQDVADYTIATDGYILADFGSSVFEDDGGMTQWLADFGGYEMAYGEAGGSVLRFKSDAGAGNPALIELRDTRGPGNARGIEYAGDYSADFTDRSLVDKAYVDSVAGGGAAVTEVLLTSASTDGSFSSGGYVGYEAANDMCETEYTGSYFCRTDEIIQFIRINGSTGFTGFTAWIAEGPPGYTSNSNDCNGWTDNLDTKLGAFWQFTNPGGGMGWLTNCAVAKPLACCR